MALYKLPACILALTVSACLAQASSYPASMTREYLLDDPSLSALSIGLDIQTQERAIRAPGAEPIGAVPEINWFTGFLGVDITPSSTIFLTGGGCSIKDTYSSNFDESGYRWSFGLNLNLLHREVDEPDFMPGHLFMNLVGEIVMIDMGIDYEGGEASIEWTEYSIALPVAYEMYPKRPQEPDAVHSLVVYAGPLFSPVDGRIERYGRTLEKFRSDRNVGLIAGVDIFLGRNLSVGAKTTYFDEASLGATLRYHF